jgi:hypothetical protein
VKRSLYFSTTALALLALLGTVGASFSDPALEPQADGPVASAAQDANSPREMRRRSARRKSTRPKVSHRAAVLNAQIDPVLDPNWYLNDPTLRRGDMVVLEKEVLVYDGPARKGPHMRTEFAELRSSTVLPSETIKLVIQMTGLVSSSEPAQAVIEAATADHAATKPRPNADEPRTSPAKGAVKAASAKPHRVTVRTFAEALPRHQSYAHRKRVADAARHTYLRGEYRPASYYSRPAYAPAPSTPFWDW